MTLSLLLAALSLAAAPSAPPAGAPAAFQPDANLPRAQVPDVYKWKLEPLFADEAACARGLEEVAAARRQLEGFRGTLNKPAKLREALELYFRTRLALNKATLYAALRLAIDQKSSAAQTLSERSLRALNEFMASASFIRMEVTRLDEAAMAKAYTAEPKLGAYRRYLDELQRRRAHVLSPEGEKLLALAGDNLWAEIDLNEIPSDPEKAARALLTELPLPPVRDEKGRTAPLTLSSYPMLRASSDRAVRLGAADALLSTLRKFERTAASTLASQANLSIFLARARGYDTAMAAYLDKDDLDPAVYRNLVSTVRANVAPLHRYVGLRKKIMGLPEVRLADLYPPIVPAPRMEIPYDQAVRTITTALAPLGDDYLRELRRGLDPAQGWLDLYPHKDKESGAFSSSVFGVHPFVKMNWFGEYDDLSTLAHEYGHAVHSQLAMTRQPYVTSGYPPFLAEIASTTNEVLLNHHLLSLATTPEKRLPLLNELVDSVRTTIYRQTLFAEFELALHTAAEAGTPVTAEFLEKTYRELVKAYYGPDFTLGPDDGLEWAYIPHLYYKFYVFSYATGLSSGIALAEKVRTGGPAARDAYLGMLAGGQSKPPLVLLKEAGVDLTKPDAIQAALGLFDRTVAEMEKLLAARPAPAPKPAGK